MLFLWFTVALCLHSAFAVNFENKLQKEILKEQDTFNFQPDRKTLPSMA